MRRLGWLALVGIVCLACGCPQHKAQPAGAGTVRARVLQGLPADWPLSALKLPEGAKGFEGRVGPAADGNSTDYTAYFTSTQGWEAVRADIQGKLRPLGYLAMPRDAADTTSLDAAMAAPDGTLIVLLSYDESKESQATTGQPGYYTLLVKQMRSPVQIEPDWTKL
jgi:hypothetical protein